MFTKSIKQASLISAALLVTLTAADAQFTAQERTRDNSADSTSAGSQNGSGASAHNDNDSNADATGAGSQGAASASGRSNSTPPFSGTGGGSTGGKKKGDQSGSVKAGKIKGVGPMTGSGHGSNDGGLSADSSSAGSQNGSGASAHNENDSNADAIGAGSQRAASASGRSTSTPPFSGTGGGSTSGKKKGDQSGSVKAGKIKGVGPMTGSGRGSNDGGLSASNQSAGANSPLGAGSRNQLLDPPAFDVDGVSQTGSKKKPVVTKADPGKWVVGGQGTGTAGRNSLSADSTSAGAQSASTAQDRGNSVQPPVQVVAYGNAYGDIFLPVDGIGEINGVFFDATGSQAFEMDGMMTRAIAMSAVGAGGIVPDDRVWGMIEGDLYHVDTVSGLRLLVGRLEGQWEDLGNGHGILWGALLDAGSADLDEMGLFRGQFRLAHQDDASDNNDFNPHQASDRPANNAGPLGPPISTQIDPLGTQRRDGGPQVSGSAQTSAGPLGGQSRGDDPEPQADGVFRIYWEIWS